MNSMDTHWLQQAVELARQGEGHVEPNPMVGCLLVSPSAAMGDPPLARGWHARFGGPHAEAAALGGLSAETIRGATLYLSLEPCCHTGKTPPCTGLVIEKRPGRVVIGALDPNPLVSGGGLLRLRQAGIEVELAADFAPAVELIRPFTKFQLAHRPWVIAKWAMSFDGKIATAGGESQWISGRESRGEVHRWRGRVDGILTGIGTALRDDPLLTARPPGPRQAVRIVCDTECRLPPDSALARSAAEFPLLVVTGGGPDGQRREELERKGAEVLEIAGGDSLQRLNGLMDELGRRGMTNLLVESGGRLLGSLFDGGLVDEVRAFLAPKILGGERAATPVAGTGTSQLAWAPEFPFQTASRIGDDFLLVGRRKPGPGGY